MSLLKKISEVGGALTLSAAMLGAPEKAEAHHPYYPAPVVVQHQHIGPFGRVWTHREFIRPAPVYVRPAPVYIQPAPVFVRPAPVFIQPQIFVPAPRVFIQPPQIIVQPAPIIMQPPVYVQPAPVYVYPPAFGW